MNEINLTSMFDLDWQIIVIIFFIFLISYGLFSKNLKKTLLYSLFFLYILSVISVTLLPLPVEKEVIQSGIIEQRLGNSFIPFNSIIDFFEDGRSYIILRQVGGNFILILPLGFLAPLIWKKRRRFWKALQFGFLFSLVIELTQLLISAIIGYTYKIFDVDDLILNTAGFAIGYLFYKVYQIGVREK